MFRLKGLLAALLLANCSHAVCGHGLPAASEPEQYHESNKKGAVASESAVCSKIGVDLIRTGGNAADAVGQCFLRGLGGLLTNAQLVGTLFCVGVIGMSLCLH